MARTLQPAAEVLLQIGPHAVTLRASLRAAVALESQPGGIASLWDGVARFKMTVIYAVIKAAATDQREADALIGHAAKIPLVHVAHCAQAACLTLLAGILAPAQGEATQTPTPPAERLTLAKFFTELFSHATSWLRWPPSEVWNASVAEIVTALEARAERELRQAGIQPDNTLAKAEQCQANAAAGIDPDFDRAGLNRLKAMC